MLNRADPTLAPVDGDDDIATRVIEDLPDALNLVGGVEKVEIDARVMNGDSTEASDWSLKTTKTMTKK